MNYPKIKKIACFGGGIIGASWATNFAMKGYPVNMFEVQDDWLEATKERVKVNLSILVEEGLLTAEDADAATKLITYTTSAEEALKDVQLIQESVPERYDIKQEILGQIDAYVGEDVIFASSTSGLLISEIAKLSKFPQRCISAHPYNPPHLIPLVELVGPEGSEKAIQTAKQFYSELGKEPVVLHKEVPGFIANRLQTALGREIADLVMRGVCSVEDADKALTFGLGIRWGIMGQNLIYQLGGGEGGVKGLYARVGGGKKSWLEDMALWTKWPAEWPDIAQKGVDEAMANRSPEIGNTNESLMKYRDKMLMGILKLHNKM